jgi:hypothetical protein
MSRLALAAAFGVFALFLPGNARAQSAAPGFAGPIPAVEPEVPSAAAPVNLALTGAVVTGVWYGGALGASFIWSNAPWSDQMKIPFAGPWLSLKDIECGNEPNCTTLLVVTRAVLMSIDGIGQAAGVAFMLESLFVPTAVPQPRAKTKSSHSRLRPFPLVAGGAIGVGLAGEL